MPPRPIGAERPAAQGGPYSFYFIGGYAHAYAAAANQYPLVELSPDYRPGYLLGDIRIIDGIGAESAEILVVVPQLAEQPHNGCL